MLSRRSAEAGGGTEPGSGSGSGPGSGSGSGTARGWSRWGRVRGGTALLLTGWTAVSAAGNSVAALVATMALPPDERGVMVLVSTVTGVVVLLARAGTGAALRAQLPAATGPRERHVLLAAYLWVTVAAAGAAAGGALLALRVSAAVIDPAMAAAPVLVAVAVLAVAQTLLGQCNELFFADGEFRRGAGWSIAAVTAGLGGILLGARLGSAAWLLLLLQGAGLLAVGVAQWYRLHRRRMVRLAAPPWPAIARLVRMGTPSLGLIIGLTLAQRVDRYILGAVAGTAVVGVYSLAGTVSGVAGLLPSALGQLAFRDVSTGGGRARSDRLIGIALGGAALAGVCTGIGGWLLLVPVFGAEFAPARWLLVPLLIAEICLAPYWVASRALLGGGWTRATGVVGAVSAVGALLLHGLSVPRWGMPGAAVAAVLLYAGLSCATVILLRRRLRRRSGGAGRHTSDDRPAGVPASPTSA